MSDPDPDKPPSHPEDPGLVVSPVLLSVEEEFADQAANFARLKHREPVFRRLVAYYTSLSHNIFAIETGIEPASEEFLVMLTNQQSQARADINAALQQIPLY